MNPLIQYNQNYILLESIEQVHDGHLGIKLKCIILVTTNFMTFSNESGGSLTLWRFGISKYYQYSICGNTFQCHIIRIIETPSFGFYGC